MSYHAPMVRKFLVGILASVLGLVAIAPVAAATPNVVDQYTEQVPTPGGNKPSGQVGNGSTNNGDNQGGAGGSKGSGSGGGSGSGSGTPGVAASGTSVSPDSSVSSTGNGSGSQGGASNSGGNGSAGSRGGSVGSGINGTSAAAAEANAANTAAEEAALDQTGLATPDSGGMGWVFPAILIASILVIGGLTFARRHRASDSVTVH